MSEGKPQPANLEDEPLPGADAPNFDLSDETVAVDGNGVADEEQPEEGSYGEPEGIFALFDREFPEGSRSPLEPGESHEFDREFSESFETMFTAVKGDGSAPLFEAPESVPVLPETLSESTEETGDNILPIPAPEPEKVVRPLSVNDEPLPDEEELLYLDDEPFGGAIAPADSIAPAVAPTATASPLSHKRSGLPSLNMDPDPAVESEALPISGFGEDELNGWNPADDGLEELSFDDSDEADLYGEDLSPIDLDGDSSADEFDEFVQLALGFEEESEDDGSDEEEDDFVVEELSGADELDPFEEISIMSSEDVAKYEPIFGENDLKFRDEEPLPDDPDPFAMEGESQFSEVDDDFDPLKEIDPFGEEAAELAESAEKDREKATEAEDDAKEESEDKPKREKKKPSSGGAKRSTGAIIGLIMFPWRIFSKVTDFLFGLIEGLIGILAKIPLIGIPFRLLGSVLSSIPMALKRVVVLGVIASIAWGGTSIISNVLPKASAEIALPDSGSASFVDVELRDGLITGKIQNTGDVNLLIFPEARIFERKILDPSSWFNPADLGLCGGDLVEVAIDGVTDVSYSCAIPTEGIVSIEPSLRE